MVNNSPEETALRGAILKLKYLLPMFEPFGLDLCEEKTLGKLSQVLPAIATKYCAQYEPVPSFRATVDNLRKFRDGLSQAVEALRDLSEPGRDYLVAEESNRVNRRS